MERVEFDLERFKNGEVAFDRNGKERYFVATDCRWVTDTVLVSNIKQPNNDFIFVWSIAGILEDKWTMLPVLEEIEESPWMLEQMESAAKSVAARSDFMKEQAHTRGAIVETDQQRLTREASTRYFEKLHKKEERAPQSVGDIEGMILAAMKEGK